LRQALRQEVEAELDALARALKDGATLYLTPEGRVTTDGRLGRLRAALERLLPAARTVYLAALAYDALRPGRLTMVVRLVPWRGGDIARELAAARPITGSQLLAAAIGDEGVAEAELPTALGDVVTALPPGAHVLGEARRLDGARLAAAIRYLERRGWLLRADGRLRWRRPVVDPRFPLVVDRVAYERALLAETVGALKGGPSECGHSDVVRTGNGVDHGDEQEERGRADGRRRGNERTAAEVDAQEPVGIPPAGGIAHARRGDERSGDKRQTEDR
jgi:hypothetical protein